MKITNNHLFQMMEIVGIIGLDVELQGGDEQEVGFRLIETLLKNSKQAQEEIETLLADLTGEDTSKPLGLIKAIKEIKNNKEVVTFFTEAFKSLQ